MLARLEMLQRPASTADFARPSPFRMAGFAFGLLGLGLVVLTLIALCLRCGRWPTARGASCDSLV